jgi:hypothetical protein
MLDDTFYMAYDGTIEIPVPPDGRKVQLKPPTVGLEPESCWIRFTSWLRRRPARRSAVYFIQALGEAQDGRYRPLARALKEFPGVVEAPELRYLLPRELVDVMQAVFQVRRPMGPRRMPETEQEQAKPTKRSD